MQKIISLFQRNYDGDRLVRDEVVPGAEWVQAGEGLATIKYDGTCCRFDGGILYKRYEIKRGGQAPANFTPATEIDPITGKQQGWVPIGDGPEDQWHCEAMTTLDDYADGTYELLGPKVQGNPHGLTTHRLYRHGIHIMAEVPTDFAGLRSFFEGQHIEGIVWHNPDGRMVKIKRRDFGLPWPPKGD